MRKRILSALLVLAMVFSMLPITSHAATISYDSSSSRNTTITVTDQSGNRISDATVEVTRSPNEYTVHNAGNGQYKFTRDRITAFYSYTIEVSAPNHSTETVTIKGNTSSTTVVLNFNGPQIETFHVYYIANGIVPDSYSGAGDAVNYGPSANNTPLVDINVNITKLLEIAQQSNSPVKYLEGQNGNQWEFIPSGSRSADNFMESVNAFWDAVISCMDEDSITAFKDTGLYKPFNGYCLKKQGDSSQHCDGILSATPPVYVVELYEQHEGTNNQPVYFGGGLSDTTQEESKFLSPDNILQQYNDRLGLNITWVEDKYGEPLFENNQFTGSYIYDGYHYTMHIYQFDDENATEDSTKNGIRYVKRSDTYYLAKFNMYVERGVPVSYVVTYTDGAANEVVFTDHEYPAKWDETVPKFTGATIRDGYIFQGWYLEKGSDNEGSNNDTIYSDADISLMIVTGNMTFHAVWAPVPKFTGTVVLILDGTYDSTNGTLLSGTPVDPSLVLGLPANVTLWFKEDNDSTYLAMTKDSIGQYSAVLENGTYHIYYSTNDGQTYTQLSDQPLIMENQNRTRYLFFNSVVYDLAGGRLDGSTANRRGYHITGSSVSVHATAPEKDGFVFAGWAVENTVLQPGALLTPSIGQPYTLTAQWIKAEDVYVTITINHKGHSTDSMRDVTFTLDNRPENSTGDYTEIYSQTLAPTSWTDGTTTITDSQGKPIYSGRTWVEGNHTYTEYTPLVPNLTCVRSDMEYTVTSHKSGYDLTLDTPKVDENGNLQLHVTLTHNPDNFNFTYEVRLHEEAKQLPQSLWPKAVNVKVTFWHTVENRWATIVQHTSTYERVELDANGEGLGSYSVWKHEESDKPYYYRIEVVSFELQDGTIVSADDPAYPDIQYVSENKRFFADIETTGGISPSGTDLYGAWWDGTSQQGTVAAIVSIPAYTVTLEPNGGVLNGTTDATVLKDQIITPDISVYVPTRTGNYVFDGWYLVEDGVMTDKTVSANDPLTSNITLRAKWNPPITVSGLITVAGAYELTENGVTTWHTIHESDRTPTLIVLLQKKTPSGYYETINQQFCRLDYNNPDYYFQNRIVGWVDYAFENLPDDGEYRISVLSSNYTASYQNEDASINAWKQYNEYTPEAYVALPGNTDPTTLTVNAHLHFTPPSFDLKYEVDASQIGSSFRPDGVKILITYRSDPEEYHPSQWTVISQMIQNGALIGKPTDLNAAGFGSGSQSVWQVSYDGFTLYDYGLRVQSTVKDNVTTDYTDDLPYTVVYQSPAYFNELTGEQSQMLKATLVPNTYKVTYDTNGGTIYGTHVTSHKWSYDTVLTDIIPLRVGYEFAGWYTDEALTQPLDYSVIDASVAEDITFYAKWIQVHVDLEVFIDHSAAIGGYATNFEKLLSVQLTKKDKGSSEDFLPVDGQIQTYDSSAWHTSGNGIYDDSLEVPRIFSYLSNDYDYSANVTLDGYYMTDSYTYDTDEDGGTETVYAGVTKEESMQDDALLVCHKVVVCLKYDPEMMDLEFFVETAPDVQKQQYPAAAEVKISAWYDIPDDDIGYNWYPISQHSDSVVQVALDPDTGAGSASGSYPVWLWFNGDYHVPYYYRIEVVALKFPDGSTVTLADQDGGYTVYSGSGYQATVYAENGCDTPVQVDAYGNKVSANTPLTGAYGSLDGTKFVQTGTLRAVIDVGHLVFHTNNQDSLNNDIFRTYYPVGSPLPDGDFRSLAEDGSVPAALRYDIPLFEDDTHNEYVFKGWYTAPDESGTPIDWNTFALEGSDPVHLYAHWFETGEVQQSDDGKQLPQAWNGTYQGFDTVGIQIRKATQDDQAHYGKVGPGLRFIAVLRQELYSQINALPGNEAGAEYGFALGKTEIITAPLEAGIPGVTMFKCSGVPDHYSNVDGNTGYRLYTCVITYDSVAANPEALAKAQNTAMAARAYIRYYDANGLYRTYYNNYTGNYTGNYTDTPVHKGCSASYNDALRMLGL